MSVKALFLFVFLALPAFGQGFAGLGSSLEGFAEVTRGTKVDPAGDMAAHPEFRIEWWYVTANLSAADGREFGVQWTLFRIALAAGAQQDGWENQQIWIGHAALTTARKHRFAEKFARGGVGQAGVSRQPFEAWIDDWAMRGADPLQAMTLTAGGADFSYALQLTSTAPPVLQGEAGYSAKTDGGQASYYFSQPFYLAKGVLNIDGEEIPVSGTAWLDREWSSQPLDARQEGWDWLALNFDSGEKLMVFRLRGADGGEFRAGTWIFADGRSTPLKGDDIALEPLETANAADRQLPVRWRLTIPSQGLNVETTALNRQSWMATLFPYWEGPISFTGTHSGRGYLEMTGY